VLRWALICGFALIMLSFALAVAWLVAVQFDIVSHGE
jgi:ABC-type transport system involved in cytochrome c biogenesis permease subunit